MSPDCQQWGRQTRPRVPALSRANAGFHRVGDSFDSSERPLNACGHVQAREGKRMEREKRLAYGAAENCPNCPQEAESYSWCGLARGHRVTFSITTVTTKGHMA